MKIELKEMHLENYKGIVIADATFGAKTQLSGKNRVGKTTMMDAYFDIITGKMADGSSPDNIRPHDANGKIVDHVEVIRQAKIAVDGKETEIRKVTKQKWRTPRGTSDRVFDGNETFHEIDGFVSKPKQFAEYMAGIAKPDVLMMCSNATPFLNLMRKSTADARKLLETMSGFSIDQFIAEHSEYDGILEITKGHAIEDVLKQLKKNWSQQNKALEKLNTELAYEIGRPVFEVDVHSMTVARDNAKGRLEQLNLAETELDKAAETYDMVSRGIVAKKQQINDIEKSANSELLAERGRLNGELSKKEREFSDISMRVADVKREIERIEYELPAQQATLKECREEYVKTSNSEFDVNAQKCSMCGQCLPEEQISTLKDEFAKRKSDELAKISARGTDVSNRVKYLKESMETNKIKVETLGVDSSVISAEIAEISKKIAELPENVDTSNNSEIRRLESEIQKDEEYLTKLGNGSAERQELRKQREELTSKIMEIESSLNRAEQEKANKENQIKKLNDQIKSAGIVLGNIGKQISLVETFSIEKNKGLSDLVNQHFRHIRFEFFDKTQEGNVFETLKIMVGGTSYFGGLNHGDKILAEIDLVRGLQEMNGLNIPIWADDTESLDSWRIPEVEQQLILIRRTDDEKMTVEII